MTRSVLAVLTSGSNSADPSRTRASVLHHSASLKLPGHCPPGVYVQQDEQDPLSEFRCPGRRNRGRKGTRYRVGYQADTAPLLSPHPPALHGVLFPPSEGIYRGGVFRFLIAWTGSVLPSGSTGEGGGGGKSKGSKAKGLITSFPRVTFQEGVGHPLISVSIHSGRTNSASMYELIISLRLPSCYPQSDTRLLSLSPRFPTWRPRVDTLPHLLYYIRDVFSAQALEEIASKETWWTDKEMGR